LFRIAYNKRIRRHGGEDANTDQAVKGESRPSPLLEHVSQFLPVNQKTEVAGQGQYNENRLHQKLLLWLFIMSSVA
jgi:hypothetical protein